MICKIGREHITARIVADSINDDGIRLTTFELEYPRFIHQELLTHKMLSKNSASSRAVPVAKVLDLIANSPAMPVHWGKNQPGMAAREELADLEKQGAMGVWREAAKQAASFSKVLAEVGVHKQISNRPTEPYQMMKTVLSGTEWANFFHLRDHDDAQPEFHELAHTMRQARDVSTPQRLIAGQWHLPYVTTEVYDGGLVVYSTDRDGDLSLEDAKVISSSCCAQVSYRNLDDTLEKAKMIYGRLIETQPPHMSPLEHQGTPMMYTTTFPSDWQPGVTHMRRDETLWSANFQGWIQARQLIENEAKWGTV